MSKRRTSTFNEPTTAEVFAQEASRPTNDDAFANRTAKTASNTNLTGASALTVRQSILPCCLVTVLFFLWGFAYGLLDTLNAKFQHDLNINAAKAGGLQASYFGAYLVCPLTFSGYILRRWGFRWTFITGLIIYAIGCFMFWPSAKFESFGGFCGSLFLVGSGLSTLETSADPYLSICGPPRLSEFRLESAQGVQAIGSVIAPLIAARAFFGVDASDLSNVQWTYLAVGGFGFLMAVVFYFAPIPEVTDADMALQAEQSSDLTGYSDRPLRKQYKLFFAVLAQFCYVGAQVAVASQFITYCEKVAGISASAASNRYAIGQGIFAIGRFASAGLLLIMKPRYLLLAFSVGVVVFIILSMAVKGEGGTAMLTMVLFFESCLFPLILTTGIRGLGRHTKRGSSFIIAAISGGALFPAVTGLACEEYGWNIGMFVPLIGFLVGLAYAVYCNTFHARELDGFRETKIGYKSEDGTVGDVVYEQRKGSMTSHVELGGIKSKGL